MKRRLLFVAPDYYGFNEVVLKGLIDYSDYTITYLKSNLRYSYKDLGQRLHNVFSKTVLRRNLKSQMRDEYLKAVVNQEPFYELLFINAPYLLSDTMLDFILQRTQTSVCVFWDSIAKIPMQKDYLNKFDVIYSFDPDDCKKYNLRQITNFFFLEDQQEDIKFDVAYLATYDARIGKTKPILEQLAAQNISTKAQIYVNKKYGSISKLPKSVEIIRKIVPFTRSSSYYLDSKAILDIAHPNQKGLSFRPFEAMGLRKKLITTNADIVNYDFYHPNNIYVVKEVYNFSLPPDFLTTDYQEVDTELRNKYHIKNWIRSIVTI